MLKFKASRFSEMSAYLARSRVRAKLSQAEVAASFGYSTPQFVSNWERGLAMPPLHALRGLVKLYKLKPEEMIDIIVDQSRRFLEEELKVKRKMSRAKQKGPTEKFLTATY